MPDTGNWIGNSQDFDEAPDQRGPELRNQEMALAVFPPLLARRAAR
jgi:hypothetical protein